MSSSLDFAQLPRVVAVVGSRRWPNEKAHWIRTFIYSLNTPTVVVSGGALGVDTLAEQYARERKNAGIFYKGFHVEPFEWDLLGKGAGHARNEHIIRYLHRWSGMCFIFAFQKDIDAKKGGSYNDIELCERLNVPYQTFLI